jgi:hypothetical protein
MAEQKPIGSGWFTVVFAGVYAIAAVLFRHHMIPHLTRDVAMPIWCAIVTAILFYWGIGRILSKDGNPPPWAVGQETINCVVGVVAATLALMALIP